jgi:hypothetical protein
VQWKLEAETELDKWKFMLQRLRLLALLASHSLYSRITLSQVLTLSVLICSLQLQAAGFYRHENTWTVIINGHLPVAARPVFIFMYLKEYRKILVFTIFSCAAHTSYVNSQLFGSCNYPSTTSCSWDNRYQNHCDQQIFIISHEETISRPGWDSRCEEA